MDNDYPSGTDQEMAKLSQYPLDTYNPNLIKDEKSPKKPAKESLPAANEPYMEGMHPPPGANYLDWSLDFLIDPFPEGEGMELQASQLMASVPYKDEELRDQSDKHAHNQSPSQAGSRGQSIPNQAPGQMPMGPLSVPMNMINQSIPAAPEVPFSSAKRRPCDHCRRRKTKCVIIPGTNTCAQCETKSIACTSTSRDESTAKRMRVFDYGNVNMGPPANDIVPPNVAIRNVAPVQDYSTMNKLLLKKTLSLQYPRLSFYVGPTSYLFDVNLLDVVIGSQEDKSQRGNRVNKIEQVNLSESISLRKVETKTQFVLKDDQSKKSFQNMSNDVDAIEKFIAPHGQILIDLYFRIIHPLYPILHKKVFLEKYSRTHREFSAPLLAAVYVLAIQWWDYDPQLLRFPKPNVEMILKIALNNYILEILKRPKLSAVQAGLLLLQCKHIITDISVNNAQNSSPSQASASLSSSFNESDFNDWVLCSQVVALSEELGLGLDCDTWKLPKWERGLRKRLAWAVFLEEKWLSLKNSRPSHIHEINWVVSNLAEEDFPEKHGDGDLKEGSSDITNGKKNFMNLIELSKIVSEISNSLFSMKAMKEVTDINEVLRIAKPIQLKLRTWYHSLPGELQMNSVQPRKLCSNGYLQLAYFAAELTLHRKIITTLYQQGSNSKVPDELLNVCRSAARSRLLAAMEFVRDLKPEHIHSFWHSSASSNFALVGTFAALLFISASSKEEADFYKEHIFNYRWILKISSKGFVQVCDSLRKLDLVLNHIPGLSNQTSDPGMLIPDPYRKPEKEAGTSYSPEHYNGVTQYMNNGQGLTPGESSRPSPVLHFRNQVQSPYGSPSFNYQYQENQPKASDLPNSQGYSPKNGRQKKLNLAGYEGSQGSTSGSSRASPVMVKQDSKVDQAE